MEAWSLDRFREPQLAADVSVHARDSAIEIERNGGRRRIQLDSREAAKEITSKLCALRNPNSTGWTTVRRLRSDDPWRLLLQRLDEWSLIEESGHVALAGATIAVSALASKSCAVEFLGHLRERVPPKDRPALRRAAMRWLELIAEDPSGRTAWCDRNFYRAVARLSLTRLRKSNPPAFEVALDVLAATAERASTGILLGGGTVACTCYDLGAMRVHLSAIADFLVRSISPDAARLCSPARALPVPVEGLALQHRAEMALRAHGREVGESTFTEQLRQLSSAECPLAVGCHVEEFHVTRRFVEMITPLMHLDLSPELRALVYRYFAEEVGHERFERDTCVASGVDAAALATACPLPLHVAFVDVFTELSALHPLAFLAAVPITEGMLGEASPINERLDALMPADARARAVYRRHEKLNVDLNHSSIARVALAKVQAVSTDVQQLALNGLALAFEVNFRAWEALTAFYGPQEELRLAQPFEIPHREVAAARASR